MIIRAPFRLLAAAVLLSTSGCDDCPRYGLMTSFSWPADIECPPATEAALYMAGFKGPGECGIAIVSVDGPGEHTEDGCTYPLTIKICSGCHVN